MNGMDWKLIALGATGAVGALVALTTAAGRRERRRRSERRTTGGQRSQPSGRRIEIVAIDEGVGRSPEQEPNV